MQIADSQKRSPGIIVADVFDFSDHDGLYRSAALRDRCLIRATWIGIMPGMIQGVRAGVAVVLLCCVAGAALAQNKEAARTAFRRANQHYALGELPQALESFKEAYRAFEDPTFLFNIGQCQRRLGKTDEAIQSFRAYLRTDAPDRAEAERLLEKLLEQAKLEKDARDKEQQEARLAAELARQREAAAAAAVSTKSEVVETRAPPPVVAKPIYKRWWLWTVVGVGVVGVGLGVGLGLGLPGSRFHSTLQDFGAGR